MSDRICLFSGLLKLAKVSHDLTDGDIAKRLNITEELLKDLENNVEVPSDELLEQFALVFQVPLSNIKFYVFHNVEEKRISAKVRKFLCVKISQVVYFYLRRKGV